MVKAALFIAGIFIFTNSAFAADTVILKNGRQITGKLKEVNAKDVVIDLGAGTVWFAKEQVETINGLSIEESGARLSTEGAFIMRDKNNAILSSAQEGLNFVSNVRKLKFKTTPEVKVVSREEIRTGIKRKMEKYYSREKLETRQKLLIRLGLIPRSEDYARRILDLVSEQVAGYYDSEEKKIYIPDTVLGEIAPGLPSITVMHEQVHALQDQYFDLAKVEDVMLAQNEDTSRAMQSIIEGEATVLMYDAFFRSFKGFSANLGLDTGKAGTGMDMSSLRTFILESMLAVSKHLKTDEGKSAVFVEDMLFPYFWGGSFIQHLVNTKGWQAVDEIYSDMPVSSEQIMHPEKYYIVRDKPMKVDFPDIAPSIGGGWTLLTEETLGEFDFYLMSKAFLDELSSKMLSEGWGGDRFRLYEEPASGKVIFISLSKWDSEKDADEFFNMYKKIIGSKYKPASVVKEDASSSHWKTDEGEVYIVKSKDGVVIIEGATEENLSGLSKALAI